MTRTRVPPEVMKERIVELLKQKPMTREQLSETLQICVTRINKLLKPLLTVEGVSNIIYVHGHNYIPGTDGKPRQLLAYGPKKPHAISPAERRRVEELKGNKRARAFTERTNKPPREILRTATGIIHINHY